MSLDNLRNIPNDLRNISNAQQGVSSSTSKAAASFAGFFSKIEQSHRGLAGLANSIPIAAALIKSIRVVSESRAGEDTLARAKQDLKSTQDWIKYANKTIKQSTDKDFNDRLAAKVAEEKFHASYLRSRIKKNGEFWGK